MEQPTPSPETKPLGMLEQLDLQSASEAYPLPLPQPKENIPSRLPRGERRRLRREWERRRQEANRRQFLAPLAAG